MFSKSGWSILLQAVFGASRSESHAYFPGRGATLETGKYDPQPPHQASRRDAITSRP